MLVSVVESEELQLGWAVRTKELGGIMKNRLCLLEEIFVRPHGGFVMKDLTDRYEIESHF